jgi:hypothetical protein
MHSQEKMKDLFLPLLKNKGKVFIKYQNIWARKVQVEESITTTTNDGIETSNIAKKGDFIVKNQTKSGEQYVLTPDKFTSRYQSTGVEKDGFEEFKPVGKIIALKLDKRILEGVNLSDIFQFMANWGAEMVAKKGDYLACPLDYSEIYRIAKKEFFETYKTES